ncbi:MAG: primosomal protein N', partial [Lachnospiraceae bacterium]|nr:primosomal protein N' [Lachnospiraceae bacterium]
IDRKVKELDRYFQYVIPDALLRDVHVGSVVSVPFGNGKANVRAYVCEITDTPEFAVEKTKPIAEVLPQRLQVDDEMLVMAHWMRNRYGVTLSKALQTVMPVKAAVLTRKTFHYEAAVDKAELERILEPIRPKKNMQARVRFLEALLQEGRLSSERVSKELNISASTIRPLLENGMIRKVEEGYSFGDFGDMSSGKSQEDITPNEEQRHAIEEIWEEHMRGANRTCLLYGITGSGKTLIYMELIERIIQNGKQAILLVPEIALTYQMVKRFYDRFRDRVAILNSRMSQGERYEQYLRCKEGQVDVCIGPRSALFSPLPDIGIIIVDEEHEDSYKNENNPKYDTRDLVAYRAQVSGALTIFGSATPSVESYYHAKQGLYKLVTLSHRGVADSHLAHTHVVDMRAEMKAGNSSILSGLLHGMIAERLSKNEQVMLFLNRRGFSNSLSCYSCGYVEKCPKCDIALTYHQDNILRCHYCGYQRPATRICPSCKTGRMTPMGIGTQKAMLLVQNAFPDAKILRMDQDTTAKKDAHKQILSAFANHEADILIGTQMIVKGHDFPNVTLVGVLLADRSLNMPVYRAAEKTFQLLTQAAGRSGRGKLEGDVVIQTYRPDHFSIQAAAEQDFNAFFAREIQYRRNSGYPPSICLLSVRIHSPSETAATRVGSEIAHYIAEQFVKPAQETGRGPSVYGPTLDGIPKVNYVYRKRVLVKAETTYELARIRDAILKKFSYPVLNEAKDLDVVAETQEERNHFRNHSQNVLLEFDVTGN